MSNLLNQLDMYVSLADWDTMSQHAETSPEELKATILETMQDPRIAMSKQDDALILSDATVNGLCQTRKFRTPLISQVAYFGGEGKVCIYLSGRWTVEATVYLEVYGHKVWQQTFRLDSNQPKMSVTIDSGLVKGELCIIATQRGGSLCVTISGFVSILVLNRWERVDLHLPLPCIPFG